jgi:hypothetical protein
LRERDAVVSGFDLSAKMMALARQRLGAETDLRVADIGQPLPYPRRRVRRRRRRPGAALPGGLGRAAGRARGPPALPEDMAQFSSGSFLSFLFFVLEAG